MEYTQRRRVPETSGLEADRHLQKGSGSIEAVQKLSETSGLCRRPIRQIGTSPEFDAKDGQDKDDCCSKGVGRGRDEARQ